jgi:hypothetical protein
MKTASTYRCRLFDGPLGNSCLEGSAVLLGPQLQNAWVNLGKQRWVTSRERQSKLGPLIMHVPNTNKAEYEIIMGATARTFYALNEREFGRLPDHWRCGPAHCANSEGHCTSDGGECQAFTSDITAL